MGVRSQAKVANSPFDITSPGYESDVFAPLEKVSRTLETASTVGAGAVPVLLLSQIRPILKHKGLGLAIVAGVMGVWGMGLLIDKATGSHLMKWFANRSGETFLPPRMKSMLEEQRQLEAEIKASREEWERTQKKPVQ